MTSGPLAGLVVLDTDIWSSLYVNSRASATTDLWRKALIGWRITISTQTRAEVIYGIRNSTWSRRRVAVTMDLLDRTATVSVDESVVQAYARLGAECRRSGHALAQKVHTGDRWVAATAAAIDVPLFSGDAIYIDAPGLRLHSV